jgi:exportin-5
MGKTPEVSNYPNIDSRIVVEIIKREWPQQWPNLLAELEVICSKGDNQTELVMFVMLRIVEDVAVLQTLEQNQRRKEIYQVAILFVSVLAKKFLGRIIYN